MNGNILKERFFSNPYSFSLLVVFLFFVFCFFFVCFFFLFCFFSWVPADSTVKSDASSGMVTFNNSNRVVSIVIPGNFPEMRVHRDGIAARSFVKITTGVSHNFLTVANRVSCSYKKRNSFEKNTTFLVESHIIACV